MRFDHFSSYLGFFFRRCLFPITSLPLSLLILSLFHVSDRSPIKLLTRISANFVFSSVTFRWGFLFHCLFFSFEFESVIYVCSWGSTAGGRGRGVRKHQSWPTHSCISHSPQYKLTVLRSKLTSINLLS